MTQLSTNYGPGNPQPAAPTGTVVRKPGESGSISSTMAGDKDMFLSLLVAQLKNQDPTSPMDQKDMMAQMAQFTSVEQMANMVKQMEHMSFNATFSQAVGLIGHEVEYVAADAAGNLTTKTSTVASVTTHQGEVNLVMEDGTKLVPADIVRVS